MYTYFMRLTCSHFRKLLAGEWYKCSKNERLSESSGKRQKKTTVYLSERLSCKKMKYCRKILKNKNVLPMTSSLDKLIRTYKIMLEKESKLFKQLRLKPVLLVQYFLAVNNFNTTMSVICMRKYFTTIIGGISENSLNVIAESSVTIQWTMSANTKIKSSILAWPTKTIN